jgi:hypothetical protein
MHSGCIVGCRLISSVSAKYRDAWDKNGCAAKGAASGDAAARIFLPQLVDFDLNFLSQFL